MLRVISELTILVLLAYVLTEGSFIPNEFLMEVNKVKKIKTKRYSKDKITKSYSEAI